MKRFLFLLILLLSVPAFAYEGWQLTVNTAATDNTTATFTLPDFIADGTAYVFVPAITSATVKVHGSLDCTNYFSLYQYNNAGNVVEWQIAASTGTYAIALPSVASFRCMKVVLGANQPSPKAITVFGQRRR